MEHLTAFLTRMPKVDLHARLESPMPGEMLARFAARQGRELPRPAERLYDCSAEDLSDFLAFLDNICSFVGTPEELAEAAEHAALESGREHILYSEMILNPTHWPQFSVPEIIAAVTAGFDRAAAQGGADCRFTLSLSRTQTGAEAMALVEDMKAHRTHRLAGLSIDGNEALAGRTGERFRPALLSGRVHGAAAAAHHIAFAVRLVLGGMRLLLQRHRRPRSGLGRLPHIALGMAGLINTVAQFFIAGAVVGRAALRADDHIVFRGKLFAAGRAGDTGVFHKNCPPYRNSTEYYSIPPEAIQWTFGEQIEFLMLFLANFRESFYKSP